MDFTLQSALFGRAGCWLAVAACHMLYIAEVYRSIVDVHMCWWCVRYGML